MESTNMTTMYTESSVMPDEDFDPSQLMTSQVHNLKEIKPIATMRGISLQCFTLY